MTLHTTDLMASAKAMYARLGYERTPDEVQPDGFVLVGFHKDLTGPAGS